MSNSYLLKAAKSNTLAFATTICKRERFKQEHLIWQQYLAHKFLLLLMPRESLKTTYFVEAKITKRILDNDEYRGLLMSGTYPHARQRIKAIQKYLLSPEAELYSPGLHKRIKNAEKWTETEICLPCLRNGELVGRKAKEYNLVGCGIDSPQTGIHVDEATLDDVVNELDKKSKARRDATIDWFPAIFDLCEKHANIHIIGTPWNPVDLYAFIEREYSDIFKIIKGSIYNSDGSVWLNDTYPPEKIDILKRNPIHFSHQYLCKAIAGEDTLFEREWFVEGEKSYNRIVWSIDPAYTESDVKDACDNGLVIWADGQEGAGWLDSRIKRESIRQFKDNSLLNYLDNYYPSMIVVENNGVQKAALDLMRVNPFHPVDEPEKYKKYEGIIPLFTGTGSLGGRDKVARAVPMADYAETRGIWYVDTPGNRKLIEQLTYFPMIDDMDGVDAASTGFTKIRKKQAQPQPPSSAGKTASHSEESV